MLTYRQAVPADAAPLAALAERTFRDTFTDSNTPENLELHCTKTYGEPIQRRELLDPELVTLVCEHAGALIGFSQVRWDPPPLPAAELKWMEIQRLYVDRAWHGQGVAQRLMAEALALAAQGRADRVWLGVFEHNPRARAFYRKCGFTVAGEHVFTVGRDPQRDFIMVRNAGISG